MRRRTVGTTRAAGHGADEGQQYSDENDPGQAHGFSSILDDAGGRHPGAVPSPRGPRSRPPSVSNRNPMGGDSMCDICWADYDDAVWSYPVNRDLASRYRSQTEQVERWRLCQTCHELVVEGNVDTLVARHHESAIADLREHGVKIRPGDFEVDAAAAEKYVASFFETALISQASMAAR
jgi:hypothetical protein